MKRTRNERNLGLSRNCTVEENRGIYCKAVEKNHRKARTVGIFSICHSITKVYVIASKTVYYTALSGVPTLKNFIKNSILLFVACPQRIINYLQKNSGYGESARGRQMD